MISEKYKSEFFEIFNRYSQLRDQLTDLERLTEFLKSQHEITSKELSDTRNRENSLINKIEQETGIKPSSQDLLEIIQNYEK